MFIFFALSQVVTNCKNTVQGFKRFHGRAFSDPYVQRLKNSLVYDITQMPTGTTGIKVREEQLYLYWTPLCLVFCTMDKWQKLHKFLIVILIYRLVKFFSKLQCQMLKLGSTRSLALDNILSHLWRGACVLLEVVKCLCDHMLKWDKGQTEALMRQQKCKRHC